MTDAIAVLFSSGRIGDVILAMILAETALLVVLKRRFGLGPALPVTLVTTGCGALLVLAMRNALVGAIWPWVAVPLVLAMVAHFAFLALVWHPDR